MSGSIHRHVLPVYWIQLLTDRYGVYFKLNLNRLSPLYHLPVWDIEWFKILFFVPPRLRKSHWCQNYDLVILLTLYTYLMLYVEDLILCSRPYCFITQYIRLSFVDWIADDKFSICRYFRLWCECITKGKDRLYLLRFALGIPRSIIMSLALIPFDSE